MVNKIIWSALAENQLEQVYEQHIKRSSLKAAKKVIHTIIGEVNLLIEEPFLGSVEESLQRDKITYRSLTANQYKIIYTVDEAKDLIKIATVYNTRRDPVI
ncbi:type II toxin-antitoxin system RelE/ParE family toxin [Aquimarina intermedia]|uniref:Plasmid stabilization system protein ParE n=1 Tax=Aquimarina intermedia TaxID=350814 RepID=A0A5S5C4K9_9FLAO|nr:type II toxin-antitoxin system RelE/ParE family toxin [Aquimarina intermedia]TYP74274.1 plasmid stabilization system protein ParE [Aquimarina intermedia]